MDISYEEIFRFPYPLPLCFTMYAIYIQNDPTLLTFLMAPPPPPLLLLSEGELVAVFKGEPRPKTRVSRREGLVSGRTGERAAGGSVGG